MKLLSLLFLTFPFLLNSQIIEKSYSIQNQEIYFASGFQIEDAKFVAIGFEMEQCLTDQARFELEMEIEQNKQQILQNNPNVFSDLGTHVLFVDPYRPKSGFSEYGYHTLQNQVDQNLTPNNNLLDYNCGERTYDWSNGNHQGTDYILWPYPWKRMQENTMEVVAAATGVIVAKHDGFYDLSCTNNGNPNWNGFALEHADGSRTIYMHFKKETLNTKEVGETVAAGEFLGIAGSSGSSNIPHLHFEVRDVNNNVIDPYQGPCNSMNTDSWWQVQEAYAVPEVNEISTHSETTQDNQCPVVENTYKKINFVPGDLVVLKLYYRDINDGDNTHIEIRNPNNQLIYNYDWVCDWGDFFPTAYAYWTYQSDNSWLDGVYTITATFGGNQYQTIFGMNTNMEVGDSTSTEFEIYPNPTKNFLNLRTEKQISSYTILGLEGRVISQGEGNKITNKVDVSALLKGTYIIQIRLDGKVIQKKFVKN